MTTDNISSAISRQTEVLNRNAIKNKIFQIELALTQTKDPEEIEKLQALLAVYKAELAKLIRRRRIIQLISFVVAFIFIIIVFLFWQFQVHRQASETVWNPSTTTVSSSSSSPSSSSSSTTTVSSSTASSSKTVSAVPSALVGTWGGTYFTGRVTVVVDESGLITRYEAGRYSYSQISSYTLVGQNTYRIDSTTNSLPFLFAQIGDAGLETISGVYISGDTLYPQYWQTTIGGEYDYSKISKDVALTKGVSYLPSSSSSYVDTKNLTESQVQSWVLATYASTYRLSESEKANYFVNVKSYNDGLVYASVRRYSDKNTRIALYRVNSDGELEEGNLDSTNWRIVSSTFTE
ncbi:hypothetical protein [Streptococcus loxodontisalivarius]|uniref:Uncharacterized protein n=1 Tax=Streptococcus loxodontisalivarius TaxID=1349415 RepID=A0ABS2PRB6_9STRE|nr:hypothetical protein [Streptococcus loxodontisalivarius]MBM7642588.1 hypothetical protein [Streptococcus loxodontisalivarius]